MTRGSKLFPNPRITGGGSAGSEARQNSLSFPELPEDLWINVWRGHAAGIPSQQQPWRGIPAGSLLENAGMSSDPPGGG